MTLTATPVVAIPPDSGPRRWADRAARAILPLMLVGLVLMALFVVEPVTVASDSMSPTLVTGQRVVLDKLSFHLRAPHRTELIAFGAPDTGDLTLKRIAGVAGDTVAIKDGVLFVNRERVSEPYLDHDTVDSVYFGPVSVPADSVFVLGDNRANSIDSRTFGPVRTSALVGRVLWMGSQ